MTTDENLKVAMEKIDYWADRLAHVEDIHIPSSWRLGISEVFATALDKAGSDLSDGMIGAIISYKERLAAAEDYCTTLRCEKEELESKLDTAEKERDELKARWDHPGPRSIGDEFSVEWRESDKRHYVYDKEGNFIYSGEPRFTAYFVAQTLKERDVALKENQELREKMKGML